MQMCFTFSTFDTQIQTTFTYCYRVSSLKHNGAIKIKCVCVNCMGLVSLAYRGYLKLSHE